MIYLLYLKQKGFIFYARKIKTLIQKSKELFSLDFIAKLSKKSKFIKRKEKINENNLFQSKNNSLSKIFKRILVTDSTVFTLPEKFYKEFKGARNEQLGSAVKIQLQFDLLSGNFTCCEVQGGITYLRLKATQEFILKILTLNFIKLQVI